MSSIDQLRPQPDNRLAFLGGFLRKPREVGSIIPSSRFLERRIVRTAGIEAAKVVVELGPGTGGTTRALLRAMRPDAKLVSIEINQRFAALLQRLGDPRLIVHAGDAGDIRSALEAHDLPGADAVLSGIPFSTMPRSVALHILHSVQQALHPGGAFVAYQVRDRVETLGREVFGPAQIQKELRNIPPMRIYRWVRGMDA
ncbi:MAG: methyltransferase domain-containing protein [Deltaproteobacteria bacterium]|nr:methyltransferase domain-containing protein [Deltaproteobacteria bacterium]MBW2360115.1 methyltransferase domain-containing protein [Deltaproteobacteria bacterium]